MFKKVVAATDFRLVILKGLCLLRQLDLQFCLRDNITTRGRGLSERYQLFSKQVRRDADLCKGIDLMRDPESIDVWRDHLHANIAARKQFFSNLDESRKSLWNNFIAVRTKCIRGEASDLVGLPKDAPEELRTLHRSMATIIENIRKAKAAFDNAEKALDECNDNLESLPKKRDDVLVFMETNRLSLEKLAKDIGLQKAELKKKRELLEARIKSVGVSDGAKIEAGIAEALSDTLPSSSSSSSSSSSIATSSLPTDPGALLLLKKYNKRLKRYVNDFSTNKSVDVASILNLINDYNVLKKSIAQHLENSLANSKTCVTLLQDCFYLSQSLRKLEHDYADLDAAQNKADDQCGAFNRKLKRSQNEEASLKLKFKQCKDSLSELSNIDHPDVLAVKKQKDAYKTMLAGNVSRLQEFQLACDKSILEIKEMETDLAALRLMSPLPINSQLPWGESHKNVSDMIPVLERALLNTASKEDRLLAAYSLNITLLLRQAAKYTAASERLASLTSRHGIVLWANPVDCVLNMGRLCFVTKMGGYSLDLGTGYTPRYPDKLPVGFRECNFDRRDFSILREHNTCVFVADTFSRVEALLTSLKHKDFYIALPEAAEPPGKINDFHEPTVKGQIDVGEDSYIVYEYKLITLDEKWAALKQDICNAVMFFSIGAVLLIALYICFFAEAAGSQTDTGH